MRRIHASRWLPAATLLLNVAGSALANNPPVAQCTDVVVNAGANCQANASIDNCSYDPDGDPVTITQTPPGPYPAETRWPVVP